METEEKLSIGEIFSKYIKIEPKVMAIETLFNNSRRFDKTNYKPPYQRNYVWTDDKASYFIESILLGTEIPPLIFFNSGDNIEVIDGRQRYETIYRYVTNKFKLKKKGLTKLEDLSNKNFDDLGDLKDTIWDTKLRIIEFSFYSKPQTNYDIEDVVKKEIFKRYNTGITPLTETEIDKAKYNSDDLNSYIKNELKKDIRLRDSFFKLFYLENDNLEILLKKIRQLLVQHKIPVVYYATKKQAVINKFYDLLSDDLIKGEEDDAILGAVWNEFIKKINIVWEIRVLIEKKGQSTNRYIIECLFWGLSVIETENLNISNLANPKFKEKLATYITNHLNDFQIERGSFYEQIIRRYTTVTIFFEQEFGITLQQVYLRNNDSFLKLNKSLSKKEKTDTDTLSKFESLRLNKPDASSISIDDISQLMKKHRFLVRPNYQRREVINKIKSSAIIESILLGIKLPPIFVYKRNDSVLEVIDGQQRLLSILGFLGKEYLDENKNLVSSEKNKFSLNLKNGILKDLDRKKFGALTETQQNKILDFDLWIIEIDHKNNPHFDPIDLFIRLNYKPYPIKENTFEMWNSYVDRNIIEWVKNISTEFDDWFYLRKNNARMDNEGLLAYLIYLQHKLNLLEVRNFDSISSFLDSYKIGDKINIRIKSKTDITKTLESPDSSKQFLAICRSFKDEFLQKLQLILADSESAKISSEKLDKLMNLEGTKRSNQSFYALWLILSKVDKARVGVNRSTISKDIVDLFKLMGKVKSKDEFITSLTNFWVKYQ